MKFNGEMEFLCDKDLANVAFWWSGAAAFLVAILTGGAAALKYWLELKARRWDRARRSYESFLDVAIANPQFVGGYWSEAEGRFEDRNKYRWFMARFLWAAEEALLHVPKRQRKEWERVVKVMLREHADFIASPEARDEVDCYFGALNRLVRERIEETRLSCPPNPSDD